MFFGSKTPPTAQDWMEAVWASKSLRPARRLLERGIDINQKMGGSHNHPALFCAASGAIESVDSMDMLRLLIDSGADIEAKDGEGRTALDYAKSCSSWEAVRILKQATADLAAKREAAAKEEQARADALARMKPQAPDTLSSAIQSGDCQKVRDLFDRSFWTKQKISISWEQLKIAVLREDEPMMQLLITWDARAPENTAQLQDVTKEQYARYIKILRKAKLPLPAVAVDERLLPVAPAAIVKESRPTDMQIGQTVPGKGIFAGTWAPKDRAGKSLGKIFNIFAAPEALPEGKVSFYNRVQQVADLKNWHGHDGGRFKNDTALYKALKEARYNGEWFIPTKDIQEEKLNRNKDKGALKNAFNAKKLYWTCTEPDQSWVDRWIWMESHAFVSGLGGYMYKKDRLTAFCHPVRAELRR